MYKKACESYLTSAGGRSQALEAATLERWITELSNAKLSPNTINRMGSSVRTVIKKAHAQGLVSSEVAQRFGMVNGVKVGAMKEKLKENARTKISAEDIR